ncbi:molybdopterin-dependent oxidoreductase, partial [uncultured Phyllobacterium sp.]|uniref:nitrate reductase n=1 Tax=uncultured Phyllobacterium sp. TaxID=253813 RepID=UPI002587C266
TDRRPSAPAMATRPGLKAVDLFKAVGDGRIKALWIMATNPADSMPEADLVVKALETCPFVVVSDINARTDTTVYAHVLLPAAGWGEKDGTVTNSERRISRQRPFLPPPGEARPDWWIITEVAKRMGFAAAFAYQNPAQIFAEHAALSGVENEGSRDFDIAAQAAISATGYDGLSPFQWPQSQRNGSSGGRFFGEGGFFTSDRRARFIAVHPVDTHTTDKRFTLNTGRVRDHWHTMTRTGKSARLSAHFAEPFAEIHPLDAVGLRIADASLVRLYNDHGGIIVRALLTDRQSRGSVFVPMHWTDQFAGSARVDTLVTSRTDPVSGQPALKMARVDIQSFEALWYGFAVLRDKPRTIAADYWALAKANGGYRIELAGLHEPDDWAMFAGELFGCGEGVPLLRYHDARNGQHRTAVFAGDALIGALYIGRQPVAVSRSWASDQLSQSFAAAQNRFQLLAGRPGRDMPDKGAIVCSCFSVGRNEIASAARSGCQTVAAIGEALKAGTNCGSCRAEIRGIVDANLVQAAE